MSSSAEQEEEQQHHRQPILCIGGKSIYLEEDWNHGIGGGLWSTGLAMAKYLATDHASRLLGGVSGRIRRVLELGSGNGFLSVCLLAVASPELVVITDTDEHLPLIEKTLKANESIIDEKIRKTVSVEEYLWGTKPSNENQRVYYDLIIGSDLAYRDALHDPLIQSLLQFSSPETITLLGVTLLDTKPIFFQKLSKAGFKYERLADHLLDPSFRGTNFGIFVIQRKKEGLDY